MVSLFFEILFGSPEVSILLFFYLNKSSNVNEGIRTILNHFYFFFTRRFHLYKKHKKHENYKAQKAQKVQKLQSAKTTKSAKKCKKHKKAQKRHKKHKHTNKQIINFFPLRCFLSTLKCYLFCFCLLMCVFMLFVHVKSSRKKKIKVV